MAGRGTRVWANVGLGIGIAVHLIFAVSLPTGILNPLFVEAIEGHGQASDFYGIYQAGANLLGGYSVYDRADYRAEAPQVVPFYYYYRYLPPTAYVAALGALCLPPKAAYWVWVGIVELLLLATVVSLLRWRVFPKHRRLLLAGLWLGFFPYYVEQIMGQYSLLMAALLWMLWRYDAIEPVDTHIDSGDFPDAGDERDACDPCGAGDADADDQPHSRNAQAARWSVAWIVPLSPLRKRWRDYRWDADRVADITRHGKQAYTGWLAWVASVVIKSYTALLALPYLRDARLKRVLAAAGCSVAVSLPYFLWRPGDVVEFLRLNFAPFPPRVYKGAMGLQTWLQDLSAQHAEVFGTVLLRLGDRFLTPGNLLMLGSSGAVLLIAAWATLQASGHRHRRAFDLAVWTTAFFLIFKSVWEYHYVMMLPAISAVYLVTGRRWAFMLGVLLGLPTLYALTPVLTGAEASTALESWPGWFRSLHFSVKAAPTLLFFLGCVVALRRGAFAGR